jgi:hypothetical protein
MEFGKVIIKIVYSIAIFIVSVIIFSSFMNRGNKDMTMTLQGATFPVLDFVYDGTKFNTSYGYAYDMDITKMRDGLTPLMPGRKVSFVAETFGMGIAGMTYEVRDIADGHLIEDAKIYDYLNNEGTITADIYLKDLIEEYTQYSLCIKLESDSGKVINYYTRIIEADDYNTKDKIDFAYYFTGTTFDIVSAAAELPTYMESNSKGDNTTFHHVDIHSSIDQVTWGGLNVSQEGELHTYLREIDKTSAILEVEYYVSTGEEDKKIYYRCNDYYRIVEGTERMHMMEYDREMEQVFSLSTGIINNNKIVLGIADDAVEMAESADGNQLAFVNCGGLYSYNAVNKSIANVYGFYEDGNETNLRDAHREYDIKVLSVDEAGNIYFCVYGYMNRGDHEGEMGMSFNYYDSVINNVEEKLFVRCDKSFELIKNDVETLSFAGMDGRSYFIVDNIIYNADLPECTNSLVVQNIPFGGLVTSAQSNMVAWVSGGDLYNATQIAWLNMETGEIIYVEAEDDTRIMPLGFFDKDLIYGIADKKDIVTDKYGETVFAISRIIIRNEKGDILKEYSENGYYISDTELSESMLKLTRVVKTEDGYADSTPDQILNNSVAEVPKNTIAKAVTENLETIVQIAVKDNIETDNLKVLSPKLVMYEGDRTLVPECTDETQYYYVYLKGSLYEITDNIAEAVITGYDGYGVVTDGNGLDIFYRGNLRTRNQIMAITEAIIEDGEDTVMTEAVCLNTMLEYYGVTKDTRSDVKAGKDITEILSENLPGKTVLNLKDCPLGAILYYIDSEHPVLAFFDDENAVLLVGFNELNVVVMNPKDGSLGKMGKNDTTALLEQGGCRYYVIK